MNGWRRHLRIARRDSPADFRDRLGAALTRASAAELERGRAAAPAGDFRDRLGVALTASAAALAQARTEAARRPALVSRARAAGTGRPARPRLVMMPRLARPLAVAGALTALAGGAAASSLWLVQVGNPNGGTNPGLSSTPPPAAALDALAVLRRAQSAADRGPGVQAALEDVNDFTTGVRSDYVRVLETTADGPVVLVPVAERTAGGAAGAGGVTQTAIADALCVYYPFAGASALATSPACWSTQQLLAGHATASEDGRFFGLAPDGVTSVSIAVPGAGTPITVPVLENFFDAALPGGPPPATGGGAPLPAPAPVVTFHSS